MINVSEDKAEIFEFDARVGLNGSQCQWSFPCLFNKESLAFFVMLGDVTIDKFTKTTFMNLVAFAEKTGAVKMILIQNRDHVQKGRSY